MRNPLNNKPHFPGGATTESATERCTLLHQVSADLNLSLHEGPPSAVATLLGEVFKRDTTAFNGLLGQINSLFIKIDGDVLQEINSLQRGANGIRLILTDGIIF